MTWQYKYPSRLFFPSFICRRSCRYCIGRAKIRVVCRLAYGTQHMRLGSVLEI